METAEEQIDCDVILMTFAITQQTNGKRRFKTLTAAGPLVLVISLLAETGFHLVMQHIDAKH